MSFIKALRGQKKIGLFYDADLPRPANYDAIVGMTKAIGGTFTGTGPVDTVTDRRTIVISGLPAAFVLLADDYIEFRQDDRHYLVSLVADSTADGSGVATIYIEPALPQLFDDAATYNLEKPCCEGYIVGVPSHSRDIEAGSISFKAKSRPV